MFLSSPNKILEEKIHIHHDKRMLTLLRSQKMLKTFMNYILNSSNGGLTEIALVHRLVSMEGCQLLRNSLSSILPASIMMILLSLSSLMIFNGA